jgi:hypothetical protein
MKQMITMNEDIIEVVPDNELIPLTFQNVDKGCPVCGAEPGQCCSSPDPEYPGRGIEHATLIHQSRSYGGEE